MLVFLQRTEVHRSVLSTSLNFDVFGHVRHEPHPSAYLILRSSSSLIVKIFVSSSSLIVKIFV